jgi:hypothetical protein
LFLACAGAPQPLNGTLAFCGYAGTSCCDAAADAALRKQFDAASVSDAPCAAVLKSILCAVRTPARPPSARRYASLDEVSYSL